MVFDVRCLRIHITIPELRPLTGQDAQVVAFLEGNANAREMLADIRDYTEKWLPCLVCATTALT
jgi:UPF0042 nucleotide-binding protein